MIFRRIIFVSAVCFMSGCSSINSPDYSYKEDQIIKDMHALDNGEVGDLGSTTFAEEISDFVKLNTNKKTFFNDLSVELYDLKVVGNKSFIKIINNSNYNYSTITVCVNFYDNDNKFLVSDEIIIDWVCSQLVYSTCLDIPERAVAFRINSIEYGDEVILEPVDMRPVNDGVVTTDMFQVTIKTRGVVEYLLFDRYGVVISTVKVNKKFKGSFSDYVCFYSVIKKGE